MKRFTALLLAALMLIALAACGSDNKTEEDKKIGASGISMVLPADFKVYDEIDKDLLPDLAVAFSNKNGDIAIYVIREDLSGIKDSDNYTADDYLQAQHEVSTGTDTSDILESDGVKYYTYSYVNDEDADDIVSLKYLNIACRSDDSCWLLQFCCRSESFDANKANFIKWSKTVTFD